MLAIVLQKADDKLLGALSLQKCKDFTVYLPGPDPAEPDYEADLKFSYGSWQEVQEPLTCLLEPGAFPDNNFVRRILRTTRRHPDFAVYHVNVKGAKDFPRKADTRKLFRLTILENTPAPLSSFVFRTDVLREKAVPKADGTLEILPTVLNCAQETPVRNVWRQQLEWEPVSGPDTPAARIAAVQATLDLYRWTESFYGDDDYPLSVGDQLKLFATEVAKLYPSFTEEELKEIMAGFQVSQGPVRKLRAASAIKTALKEREQELE